jgi:CRP-like cAMP-binding protein
MEEVNLEFNALLRALEPAARARLAPHLHKVELRRGEILHDQGQMVDRIHFPLAGLVAVVSESEAGESVQTGMIGCDGAVGAFEAFGSGQFFSKGFVQVPGVALRIGATRYRDIVNSSSALESAMERYIEMTVVEARQLMLCNALHGVQARLCRSILDTLDRSCLEGSLPLTQGALAQMLGVQRTTIASCVSKLQRDGLIKSGRGTIEIVDQERLERLTCDCRRALQLARYEIWAPPEDVGRSAFG